MPHRDPSPPPIEILDQIHSTPEHVKMIHVGAGAAGLLLAYKARKLLENFELICYEKNPQVGGTWYENKYPGCACDIPAHTYVYTFEGNTEWTSFYSGAAEIEEYFLRFYHKYQLEPYVKLEHEVLGATWKEDEGIWDVELRHNGIVFHDWCHVLINGAGAVNKWKCKGPFTPPSSRLTSSGPVIEGLHDFQGKLVHSAAWDTDIDQRGKRIAVIGTGSSSIQMVPKLADGAEHVTVFMRNSTWIAPQIPSDKQQVDDSGREVAIGKHYYTDKEKETFRSDAEFHLQYRKTLESRLARKFPVFLRGTPDNMAAIKACRNDMLAKIGPGHEELKEKLIPTWSPGCRRMTPGENYLETLIQPHVTTLHDEIVKITPTGLVTASGKEVHVDIIACGTGFDTAIIPHFKITGLDGLVMQEDWAEEANTYLSIAGPGFPNYWCINGPRGNWGQGCALPSHEVQIEYALQCVSKMQQERIKSMVVKQQPTTDFNNHLDAWHKKYSVWAETCRSWYKKNKTEGRVYVWGGTLLHHLKTLRTPRYEHYEITYKDGNDMWSFLGNGFTQNDRVNTIEGLTPYIRNADTAWELL